MNTAALRRRRIVQAAVSSPPDPPEPGDGDILFLVYRLDPGTGSTRAAKCLEFADGEMLAEDLDGLSCWFDGVEVAVCLQAQEGTRPAGGLYSAWMELDADGMTRYDDGGTPKSGFLSRSIAPTISRLTKSDDATRTAWMTNGTSDNSAYPAWKAPGNGTPPGVIVRATAEEWSAALWSGPYVSQAEQPVFAGSTEYDDTFEETYAGNPEAWDGGYGSHGLAHYGQPDALLIKAARLNDVKYLERSMQMLARLRTMSWIPSNYAFNEAYEVEAFRGIENLYRLFDDTVSRHILCDSDEGASLPFSKAYLKSVARGEYSPGYDTTSARYYAGIIRVMNHSIRMGFEATDVQFTSLTPEENAKLWIDKLFTYSGTWDGNLLVSRADACEPDMTKTALLYMNALFIQASIELLEVMSASTQRTLLDTNCQAMLVYMYDNWRTTSVEGTIGYPYMTVPLCIDVGTNTTVTEVDLNGLFAACFAWLAMKTGNVDYADEARALIATISLTPQDGFTGPNIDTGNQKQWAEAYAFSQRAPYYLKRAFELWGI